MYRTMQRYLTPNPFSRPGDRIQKIKGIVIHYVANPKSTADANRNFFENRRHQSKTDNKADSYGSAHEIIDLDGSIVLCVPENEVTYNCGSQTYTPEAKKALGNYPNNCTYSIECCHTGEDGSMTKATYDTLIERCSDLCKKYGLNPLEDLWLHKEVVGWKDCHKWFVENPEEWKVFKSRVNVMMSNHANTSTPPQNKPATPQFKPFNVTITAESGLNIRKQPDEKAEILGAYKFKDVISVIGQSGDWYKTSKGYISKDYAKK